MFSFNCEYQELSIMSEMQFKYFSDFQCEMCLPWVQLTNRLEVAMKQFSKGEVTQPVRTTLKINEADGTSFCEY
jgi:hypothetical protein